MWPFKAKPPPDNDITLIPVTLDEAHTYVQPKGDYPADYEYGTKDYSAQVYTELPAIPEQDRILINWYRPPDAGHPQRFWDDANNDKIARGVQERFQTNNWTEKTDRTTSVPNPWLDRHPLPRVTSDMSPSNFRFERPFDQDFARTFDGNHFSMATNRRTYGVLGMEPPRSFRNTFRLEPVARDAENMDLAGTNTPTAEPAVYISPAVAPSSRWGL